jgi:hypothetical protein
MFGRKNKSDQSVPRPLTQDERDLVQWLLEHGDSEHKNLISQIDNLTVVRTCSCGCPTVNFALNGKPVPPKGERIISDLLATVDGKDVGVLLFQNEGRLSCLEVYSCAGSDKAFGLPAISTLYSYEEAAKRAQNPQ